VAVPRRSERWSTAIAKIGYGPRVAICRPLRAVGIVGKGVIGRTVLFGQQVGRVGDSNGDSNDHAAVGICVGFRAGRFLNNCNGVGRFYVFSNDSNGICGWVAARDLPSAAPTRVTSSIW
jgi:hypothetical protein